MISKSCAEFLDLPQETNPELARGKCLQFREQLRQSISQAHSGSKDAAEFQERLTVADKILSELTALTNPAQAAPESSRGMLNQELRSALDLDENADVDLALAKAETRLKEIIQTQGTLKPKHPAHPKLKRDRERFEKMVGELRVMDSTRKVDLLCDDAEDALGNQRPSKSKVRDLLRKARMETSALPSGSICVARLQKLEAKLESLPGNAPEPVELPRENPFLQLESLIDKGMSCLAQETPDQAEAQECFAQAEKEAAGKTIPANLKSRMQLFKRTLGQVRRESLHAQINGLIEQSASAMTKEPADTSNAREKLGLANTLLREAPDPYFQAEVNRRERAIEEHEQWLERRSIEEEAPAETLAPANPVEPSSDPDEALPTVIELERPAITLNAVPPPDPEATLPEVPPIIPEITSFEPPEPPLPLAPGKKRNKALELAFLFLILGLFGAACASYIIFKITAPGSRLVNTQSNLPPSNPEKVVRAPSPPPIPLEPDMGELVLTVIPTEAELFTNGISLGHPSYPLHLRGPTGEELILTAILEGYSNAMKSVTFRLPQSPLNETLELQPKPALLIVRSQPAAPDIMLREGRRETTVTRLDEGIEVSTGVPLGVSVELADYDIARTNLPAFKPGEQRLVDFGNLHLQTATLRVKAQPADTQFSVVYLDRPSVPFGSANILEGIIPRVPFELIAERPGYASASNSFLLKPREVAEYDFGKLKPLSASVVVTATPANFDLKVAWDGASKDYGPQGRAAGLPPGKSLLLTVSAAGFQSASTNVVLEAGEMRELFFGGLQPAQSFILVKSDPPGAEVTYSIDGHFPISLGVTNRIDNLPLGHTIEVTLQKAGYVNRPMTRKLLLAGDTLDFGHLTPVKDAEAEKAANARAQYNAAQIEKLVRQIQGHIITVRNNVPLTETSRRDWNQWINQVEAMQRYDAQISNLVQPSLNQLRDLVNRTTPLPTNPIARNSE
jgi:hypothetical protein